MFSFHTVLNQMYVAQKYRLPFNGAILGWDTTVMCFSISRSCSWEAELCAYQLRITERAHASAPAHTTSVANTSKESA